MIIYTLYGTVDTPLWVKISVKAKTTKNRGGCVFTAKVEETAGGQIKCRKKKSAKRVLPA